MCSLGLDCDKGRTEFAVLGSFMTKRKRRIGCVWAQLLAKSREAALNAAQTFNNPLTTFKTETFIVLMVIAWMYLLHAYYRKNGVDYRYYQNRKLRRRYERTKSGAYKYWELERCLNEECCPLDSATRNNLRFLIGLRHEIEHHESAGLDEQLSSRYLACCLNYERVITELFDQRYGLGSALSFTLQFRDITKVPISEEVWDALPSNIARYLQEFDAVLPDDDFQSPYYAYRLLFIRKLTNRRGQADRAIEFIPADSPLGKAVDHDYWVLREVERKKYRPGHIVRIMNEEGYPRFGIYDHIQLWKKLDAKNPGKGYGTEVVLGQWLWYDRWVEVVRRHCKENTELYGTA
jgi:hypothetical protein